MRLGGRVARAGMREGETAMLRGLIALGALALTGGLLISPCQAATTTATFNVTATVLSSCVVSATDLAFGNYTSSSGSLLDATSTVQVTCTGGSAYTVALDGGTAADVSARAMSDGAAHALSYGLYTTNARDTIWGDGTAGSVTQSGTGDGTAQSLTVYGRVPASQFVAAGAYSDLITVTLSY